jgi:hypothetical protein
MVVEKMAYANKQRLHIIDVTRWDEKAGLRRDALGSQGIGALEAQERKETDNEKD